MFVPQVGLEFANLMPQVPECWGYRSTPPSLAGLDFKSSFSSSLIQSRSLSSLGLCFLICTKILKEYLRNNNIFVRTKSNCDRIGFLVHRNLRGFKEHISYWKLP